MVSLTDPINSPKQELTSDFFEKAGVRLFVKREDLIHPLISGNKYRKLKFNLLEAEKQGLKSILSFGGAFSNHIYSLAAAGKLFGFETIGLIRGEKHSLLNPTLSFAESCGMKLIYLNRSEYKNRNENEALEEFKKKLSPFYFIPEGGSNPLGVKGCEEILNHSDKHMDFICTAAGTGGTVSGLINSAGSHQKVLGFCVLKGKGMLDTDINQWTFNKALQGKDEILYDYHFGGYAKITSELICFMQKFERRFNIPLEPVYTAKMFYGLFDLIQKGYFPKGSDILAIHTGGLQGLEGMKEKMSKLEKSDIFDKFIF